MAGKHKPLVEIRLSLIIWIGLIAAVSVVPGRGTAAFGQDQSKTNTDSGEEPAAKGETGVEPEAPLDRAPDRDEARRRAYTLGIITIGGILICGVSLVALVLLWGNRLRRITRQPPPRVAPRDELWFLKGKKKPEIELEDQDTEPLL